MPVTDLNQLTTLMGWNQLIKISYPIGFSLFTKPTKTFTNPGDQVLRVESYDIGVRQEAAAPDYITGKQDRTAWRKGPITSEGNLNFPFTLPSSGSDPSGMSLFIAASELVKDPSASFSIETSAHPKIAGCKVNNASISCSAENEITASATVWGIVEEEELKTIRSFGDIRRQIWGRPSDTNTGTTSTAGNKYFLFDDHMNSNGAPGVGTGATAANAGVDPLLLEQIPMWDVCSIQGAPAGMFVVGFSLEVDNALVRNYSMGTGSDGTNESYYSPFGLNATSISANQRTISGTITWQSDYQGYISQVLGSGISTLIIDVADIRFRLNNVVWNAIPPTLSTGDRVTVETPFTALGTGDEVGDADDGSFDALQIEDNPNWPPA